jgi:hypothetical protein
MLNLKLLAFSIIAVTLITSLSVISFNNIAAQPVTKQVGSASGAVNTAFSTTINTFNTGQMGILLQAVGGNFSSSTATVAVSVDNANFITVDSISLGTATIKGLEYSSSNLTSTGVNPTLYPFVKVSVPQISSVSVKATWTLG